MMQMPDRVEPPNPPLRDGPIAVRPFRPDDVDAVVAACQDPEIQRWIPLIPIPYTDADARRYVMMTLQAWHDGTSAEFAIVDATTDLLLGSIGLHLGPNPRRYAIGYWVAPAARRRGVAVRAVRLVSRWGFERLHMQRLSLWTLPGNVASQAVAEAAGFRFEGLARNWETDRDDQPIDAVVFGLTPEDLAEASQTGRDAGSSGEAGRRGADGPSAVATIAAVPRELHAAGTRAAPFVDLAAVAALRPGTMTRVTLADLDLLVVWTPDGILVTDDRCPHMSAPLSVGGLAGNVVACPLHEGQFNLCTGETVQMPTTGGLDADGRYHSPWSPTGALPKSEPPSKKLDARRLTRVNRLRYYPARIRDGRLEAQLPILPE